MFRTMQTTFRWHGQHKWFIHGDSVVGGNIQQTYINSRGLIHGHTMIPKGAEEKTHVIDVRRNDCFDDKEKAMKTLFRRKLKGEA